MEHQKTGQHTNQIHRQHDDWDEVHNQLLAIQKKSLEVSDPNDADEKEADNVARKVVDGQSAEIHGTGGTINRKGEDNIIQRKHGDNKLTVDVTGPIAHADGVYSPTSGTLRTPKNDSGYTETLKTAPGDLYDTYYSIAMRFGIDVKELMAENPGRPEDKIFHDIDIYIPDIAPVKTAPVQPVVTPDAQLAEEVLTPSGPKSITSQEDVRTYDDFKRYDLKTKDIATIAADVQKTAWAIVQSDSQVRHTYEFLHMIERDGKQEERDKVLDDFFEGGDKKPALSIIDTDSSGGTPEDFTTKQHKSIYLNDQNSFTVNVATYLHELNHYIDIWYNSEAAGDSYKARQEMEKGIEPEEATKTTDLSKTEQTDALGESLNATINQIILEMQRPPRPNDHPRVEGEPKRTKGKYKGLRFRKSYDTWAADTDPKKETYDEFINGVRKELAKAAIGRKLYGPWGAKKNAANEITETTRIEMGFAFEKMAYGFNTGEHGEWAVDLIQKFEEKYFTFLEDR
jgi:hypothetical protein